MFKNYVRKKLEKYVKEYFSRHPEVKLIVVAGSVGKTSAKVSIGTVLSQRYRVRLHEGNHNTEFSAPLAILGIDYPENVKSIKAWRLVFAAAQERIRQVSDVDVIVQELGIDRVGEMAQFGSYLRPDIAVITAITPEHMEFFGTIDVVAQEELMAANFSQVAIINREDIDGKFAGLLTNSAIDTYGTTAAAEYRFEVEDYNLESGYTGSVIAPEYGDARLPAKIKLVGEHSLRPAMAAVAVGIKLGLTPADIAAGLAKIKAVPGRMNVLRGAGETTIIDDTYNSSPAAASAALQTLYSIEAPARIAILGSMNELGAMSADEHKRLGAMCNPNMLDWVVTIGEEAEKYLAPEARIRGCQTRSFKTALEAGAFVHSVLEPGAVILAKGSQGGIFAEEAVKIFLHESHEAQELVRQSLDWIAKKDEFFSKFS